VAVSVLAGIAFVPFFGGQQASATVNRQINFQGKIVNKTGGTNITNGTYNMQFKIYSGGDGVPGGGDETLLWTESRLRNSSQGVVFADGVFQVNLGSVTTLPGSVDFNNSTLWLSMEMGNTNASCTPFASCAPDSEMDPMVRFTASPYSFNSDLLDGIDSAAFGQLASNQTWTGTQTLQPTTNVSSLVVQQTSVGSPTADILKVSTVNGTNNAILVIGPAANEAAVSITSFGTGRDISLNSADQIILNAASGTSLTSTLAGTLDVLNITGTPNTSANTAYGLYIDQANSANGNGFDASLVIDNSDSNLAIADGMLFINGGGGFTRGITFAGATTDVTTASGEDLTVAPGGTGTLTLTSAGTGIAAVGINVTGSGGDLDINVNDAITVDAATMTFTLAAGTTDFTIAGLDADSNLILPGMAGANAILFAAPTTGVVTTAATSTGSQCLVSGAGASGTPTWGACGGTTPDLDAVYAQSITNTNLNMEIDNAGGLTFDLTTTGDFAVRDGTTAFATFANTGAITFAPTSGQSLTTTIAGAGTLTNTISGTGNATFNLTSTGDFVIQDNGTAALTVDDSGNVTIGVSDATGTLLNLDTKTTATDPSGSDGAMYYNSDSKNFRCRHNGLWQDCDFASLRSEWMFQDDFVTNTVTAGTGASLSNVSNGWTFVSIGTGGTIAKTNVGTDASNQDRFGVLQMNSPATVTTGVHLRQDNTSMAGVPSNLTVEFAVGPVNAAAATAQQQTARVGLLDSTTSAAPTDGIYFMYTATTTAGNWQRCTQTTCVDTGVARTTTANQYQRFRIQTNSAGTGVEFFINEASVGTASTNLPGATASYGPTINFNTVDATIRQWKIDYFQIKRNLTTLR